MWVVVPTDLVFVSWDCAGCRLLLHSGLCSLFAILGAWDLTAAHSALFSATPLKIAVSIEIEQQCWRCIIHWLLLKSYSSGKLEKIQKCWIVQASTHRWIAARHNALRHTYLQLKKITAVQVIIFLRNGWNASWRPTFIWTEYLFL